MSAARKRRKMTRRQRIWLSVAATVVGTGALVVAGVLVQSGRDTDKGDPTKGLTSAFRGADAANAPPIRFSDVAAELGIRMQHGPTQRGRALPEDTGSGLAWADVDDDGDWDLYVVNYAVGGAHHLGGVHDPSNRLFRNDGGRFTDITRKAGVGDFEGFGMGASFADYDDDGDVDLYVTNRGPNRLFRNRGDGTFEDVTEEAGVGDPLWSTGVAWGDYDRDGNLDLYVCNYVRYDADNTVHYGAGDPAPASAPAVAREGYVVPFTLNPNAFDPEPNSLYRNRGDGTFEEVAGKTFTANPEGRSFAATFCDLDGDGWLDLYVNNDVSANRLFRNLGWRGEVGVPVYFAEIGVTTGTADPRGSMGLSVAEMGWMQEAQDDLPDLFITHWVAQENAFYLSLTNTRGRLEYRDKTRRMRLGEISLDTVGWGSALVDLDLDGRLDLAVANGSTLENKQDTSRLIEEPIFLLWNTGAAFVDLAQRAGPALARRYGSRGLAAADFDGDGDVDLAVSVNRGAPLLLRNDTETENHSIRVRLDAPAARAYGARVVVRVGERRQMTWFGADVSFCSQHAPELIFGLGTATHAGEVEVTWTDGTTSIRKNVAAGVVTMAP